VTGTARTANRRRRPAAATLCFHRVRDWCKRVLPLCSGGDGRGAAGPLAKPMVHALRATVDAIGHVVRNDRLKSNQYRGRADRSIDHWRQFGTQPPTTMITLAF